jgi:hypothetical protein
VARGPSGPDGRPPAWLRVTEGDQSWPAGLALAAVIVLQFALPADFVIRPSWIVPAVETALLLVLVVVHPARLTNRTPLVRRVALTLMFLMAAYVAVSLVFLVRTIVVGHGLTPTDLLLGGGGIWLSNVLVFALIYWEFDRGGPVDRANAVNEKPDLLFPQMGDDELAKDWEPIFFDYFFVSLTCSTAYSPTDTMPLTRWCKALFTAQLLISVVTISLVTARAVNILPGN